MRAVAFASSFLSAAVLVSAQVAYDPASKQLLCAKPDATYCLGDSLKQTLIVHCKGHVGTPSCCTAELSSLPPVGLKTAALCFASSTIAGDAACSINGTVYPQSGSPFALPVPAKPLPVPAVVSFGDKPPENCGCHNGTHPLGPAGPTGSIIPPPGPTAPVTPVQPVKPPPMPTGSIMPYPPPHHGGGPMPTLNSSWKPKPTPTPTASTTPKSPVTTGAASRKNAPAVALALGFIAMLL